MSVLARRLEEIVERLQPMKPLKILLFGSAARDQVDDLSDIDLIIVAEQVAARFLDRIADAYDLIEPRYAIDILPSARSSTRGRSPHRTMKASGARG